MELTMELLMELPMELPMELLMELLMERPMERPMERLMERLMELPSDHLNNPPKGLYRNPKGPEISQAGYLINNPRMSWQSHKEYHDETKDPTKNFISQI